MKLINTLRVKPWLPQEGSQQEKGDFHQLNDNQAAKTALNFFLTVITVIFFLFTITFLQRTQSFDFQALSGEPWLPFTDASMLWQNTGYLLLASITIIIARRYAELQHFYAVVFALTATTLFTSLFIIGQFLVWQQLNHAGFYINTNPANSFYFLLSGIHALHVLGGVIVLVSCIGIFATTFSYQQLSGRLKLCARYWHYLFFVWLFLFFLLTSDANTFKTIALICGF